MEEGGREEGSEREVVGKQKYRRSPSSGRARGGCSAHERVSGRSGSPSDEWMRVAGYPRDLGHRDVFATRIRTGEKHEDSAVGHRGFERSNPRTGVKIALTYRGSLVLLSSITSAMVSLFLLASNCYIVAARRCHPRRSSGGSIATPCDVNDGPELSACGLQISGLTNSQHPRGGLVTAVEYDVSPGHQPLRRACTTRRTYTPSPSAPPGI